jgi:hypothetical protein
MKGPIELRPKIVFQIWGVALIQVIFDRRWLIDKSLVLGNLDCRHSFDAHTALAVMQLIGVCRAEFGPETLSDLTLDSIDGRETDCDRQCRVSVLLYSTTQLFIYKFRHGILRSVLPSVNHFSNRRFKYQPALTTDSSISQPNSFNMHLALTVVAALFLGSKAVIGSPLLEERQVATVCKCM